MIKFFRKIRQKLLTENKFSKYLIYAVGEIVLVIIGILIALQLNNSNENRKNEDKFKAVIQQIYTVIDYDIQQLTHIHYEIAKQIDILESIQQNSGSIEPKLLPHLLFYLDTDQNKITSEVPYQLSLLNFNPENLNQSNLNKSLASYGNSIKEELSTNKKYITPFLEKLDLPFPNVLFGYSVLNDYQNIDTTFFSETEINKSVKLLENPLFRNALKSSLSRKELISILINNQINLAKTNKTAIREYYPSVKLLYANIGLLGTATKNKWEKNIPLTLTNDLESIWEGDVVLEVGFVKFREGENWNFNWGGDEFPSGTSLSYGNNIKAKAGNYHVIFNLSNKSYKFIKQ